MVIPLGATVQWRDTVYKSAWSGVVTAHPRPGMVEVDGAGAISEGLLEVVSVTLEEMQLMTTDQLLGSLRGEIAGLQAIVIQQCELISAMSADDSEFKRLQQCEEDFQRLRDAVSDALLALTGTRRPSGMDLLQTNTAEIAALVLELERTELPSGD